MYEAFYGLREKPFPTTADPAFLYLSRHHEEALGHLFYGIQERLGFLMITGEVGTGKTTLAKAILEKLPSSTKSALVLNPTLSAKELLRQVLRDFGEEPNGATRGELVALMERYLLKIAQGREAAVLIVDEAQDLTARTLEQIRLLSNVETPKSKLLQIVLVGQPELEHRLTHNPRLRALHQRIAVRYQIKPLEESDVARYMEHRLRVAGLTESLFTEEATRLIAEASAGIPRRINLLCDKALLAGFVREKRMIDANMLTEGGVLS